MNVNMPQGYFIFAAMNTITLKRTNSLDPDFRLLITELDAELRATYDELMNTYDQHNIIEEIATVVIAYVDSEPAGCGCFKKFSREAAEVKRMYVKPQFRGMGISAKVLKELETWAASMLYVQMILETGEEQFAAISLYQKRGYVRSDNYGPYVGLSTSLCYSKDL
jgi:putative acetyltransferase